MKKSRKIILTALCAVALVAASVLGTLAYLTEKTDAVKNTFVLGSLLQDEDEFVLKEHVATANTAGVYTIAEGAAETNTNEYKVLPGVPLPKDPFVKTTSALQLDAYVFIEVVESEDFGDGFIYSVDTDLWEELANVSGPNGGSVYKMKANNGIAAKGNVLNPVYILAGDTNNPNGMITVTSEGMNATDFAGALTFYGYMIQKGDFANAADAWNAVYPASTESGGTE